MREALLAVEYWRTRRLAVDLVILNERASSYVQDLQQALETLVRANQSRPQIGEARGPGHVFLLRADLISEDVRATAGLGGARRAGGRARTAGRPAEECARGAGPRAAVLAAPRDVFRTADSPRRAGPGILQRPWRLRRRPGASTSPSSAPGQPTPAPWINVIANPDFGFQVSAEGGGYIWSVNEPRAPADALVERSGHRPAGAGDLCARRGHRRAMDADRRCRCATRPRPTSAATASATAAFECHARTAWRSNSLEYVAPDRSGQDLAADAAQHVAAPPAAFGDRLRGMGAWAATRPGHRPIRHHRPRRSQRRADRRQRLEPGVCRPRAPSSTWAGARRPGPAIGASSSAATARWPRRAALIERAPLSGRVGAGLDPCGALQTTVELAPGESVEVPVLHGRRGGRRRGARARRTRYGAPISTRCWPRSAAVWERDPGRRAGQDARPAAWT